MNAPRPRPLRLDHPSTRSGFSLFEILLSLALLAAAMGAVSQLMETGLQAGLRNQLRTEGQFLCEQKLAELIVDPTVQESSAETAFPDNEGWKWSVATAEGPRIDLLRLEITVIHYTDGQSPREDMRVTLIRLVRIPTDPPEVATSQRIELLPGGRV